MTIKDNVYNSINKASTAIHQAVEHVQIRTDEKFKPGRESPPPQDVVERSVDLRDDTRTRPTSQTNPTNILGGMTPPHTTGVLLHDDKKDVPSIGAVTPPKR